MEWDGLDLVVVHCDRLTRHRLASDLLGLLSCLGEPASREDIVADHPRVAARLDDLIREGLVEEEAGACGDSRTTWSAPDLLVYRRATRSQPRAPSGPPPALFNGRPGGPVTGLPLPSSAVECPLSEALARRRSIRKYGTSPLGLGELSSLLEHSARLRRVVEHPQLGQVAFHPYPTGGGRSELELYVVANAVEGLTPGAYFYDARSHELVLVRRRSEGQARFARWVGAAAGGLVWPPAAVVVITAVFARTLWKYRELGLSLVYQDTGCLLQTLYLVATALGMAPCAVGSGGEPATSRWLGLDPLVEGPVACMLLGTRPGK